MSTSNSSILNSRKPFITRPRTRMRNSCNVINNGRNNNTNKYQLSNSNGKSRSNSSCSKPSVNIDQLESIREKLFQMKENENNNENNANDENSSSKSLSDFQTDELQQVFPYLRDYAHRKGCEEDYDNAQTAFSLSEDILNELKARSTIQNTENNVSSTGSSKQASFEEKWKKQLESYNEETDKKRKELQKSHEEQIESFEKLWNEDMPRKYRKPSQQLLQIKKVEKSLALACEFERAKQVHQEYEQLAAKELEQAQNNLNRDYEIAHAKLIQKQQQEVKNFEDTRFHLLNLKKTKYENQKAAFENRSRVVQTRKMEGQRNSKNNTDQIGANFTYSYSSANENDNENPNSNNAENHDFLLLPELIPPNDPQYVEEDKKRKRELNKKKLAYQKQNAELTLARYTVDGQDFSYPSSKSDNDNKIKQKNKTQNISKNQSQSMKQNQIQDQSSSGNINQDQNQTNQDQPTNENIDQNQVNQDQTMNESIDQNQNESIEKEDPNSNNNNTNINQDILQEVAIQVDSAIKQSISNENNVVETNDLQNVKNEEEKPSTENLNAAENDERASFASILDNANLLAS